jgi:hypothetical protein
MGLAEPAVKAKIYRRRFTVSILARLNFLHKSPLPHAVPGAKRGDTLRHKVSNTCMLTERFEVRFLFGEPNIFHF